MGTLKNLGYAEWLNQYGWMESMKGPRWKSVVQENQIAFQKAVEPLQSLTEEIQAEFASSISYVDPLQLEDADVQMTGTLRYLWKWRDSTETHVCADLDVETKKQIWFVADKSSGAERYTLSHMRGDKLVWYHKKPVGPFVAVVGDRVYVIEAKKDLWYQALISFNKRTGKDHKIHLRMVNHRWNLALFKGQHGCLFCLANNAGKQRLWHIKQSGGLEELTGDYESFVPVGVPKGGKEPCFFGRRVGSRSFEPVGTALKNEELPNLFENIPQWFSFSDHFLCTRRYGLRTLWNTKTGKHIDTIVGEFELNDLAGWRGANAFITVSRPGYERVMYPITNTICAYADATYLKARSADGTHVPLIVTQSCKKPVALLCVAYGGYGLPTHLDVSRWKPLLRRGWCIALCLVRGSGDHDDAWAESARRENKIKSVEDLEACIRMAQQKTHVPAGATAIYGRSAGGYLAGATLARNTDGKLFRAVYTEVPYVDVLATTANPSLPLTELEYEEFGNPLERIADAQALVRLSPIHALPATGAPRIFVLNRTGLQDKEVFAYESVKWMTMLQESQKGIKGAEPKLLAITADEGHFVGGSSAFQERAEDLALLVSWNKKSHVQIYKMANTRRNRRSTRKNNVARKNNAVTLGGKRKGNRKASTRKGRKGSKGRKGGRKH